MKIPQALMDLLFEYVARQLEIEPARIEKLYQQANAPRSATLARWGASFVQQDSKFRAHKSKEWMDDKANLAIEEIITQYWDQVREDTKFNDAPTNNSTEEVRWEGSGFFGLPMGEEDDDAADLTWGGISDAEADGFLYDGNLYDRDGNIIGTIDNWDMWHEDWDEDEDGDEQRSANK